jgi:hypothetical protein
MLRLDVDLDVVPFHTLHDEEHMSSYLKQKFEFSSMSKFVDPLFEDRASLSQLVMDIGHIVR